MFYGFHIFSLISMTFLDFPCFSKWFLFGCKWFSWTLVDSIWFSLIFTCVYDFMWFSVLFPSDLPLVLMTSSIFIDFHWFSLFSLIFKVIKWFILLFLGDVPRLSLISIVVFLKRFWNCLKLYCFTTNCVWILIDFLWFLQICMRVNDILLVCIVFHVSLLWVWVISLICFDFNSFSLISMASVILIVFQLVSLRFWRTSIYYLWFPSFFFVIVWSCLKQFGTFRFTTQPSLSRSNTISVVCLCFQFGNVLFELFETLIWNEYRFDVFETFWFICCVS